MKNLILAVLVFSSILGFGQFNQNKNTITIGTTGNITTSGASISVQSLNSISADSALRINTSRPHKDILCDISTSSNTATDWTIEQYGTSGYQIPYLRHDQNNYIYGKIQYNHDKALNVDADDVHLHAVGMSATGGNVHFVTWYKWINYGEVLTYDTTRVGNTWGMQKFTVPILDTDQFKVKVINVLENVPHPANETPSSILFFITMRNAVAGQALDTYSGNKVGGGTNQCNFGLFYSDSHYQVSKLGSKNEASD